MTVAPVGSASDVDTPLFNNGDTQLVGVQAPVRFLGPNGQTAEVHSRPVGEVTDGSGAILQNLMQHPIKPHPSRPVRIYFDRIPADWNKEMPEITVMPVTKP